MAKWDTADTVIAPARHSHASEEGSTAVTELPSTCTLSGFTAQSLGQDGIDVQSLEPLTRLRVKTQNSTYEVWIVDPDQWSVFIRGGSFFPTPTPATLCGSGFGGSLLKVAWVGIGMSCELTHSEGRIVTSPIRNVEVLEDAGIPGLF